MGSAALRPSSFVYNSMIARCASFAEARAVAAELEQAGARPHQSTVALLMRKMQTPEQIREVIDLMMGWGIHMPEPAAIFNVAMSKARSYQEARELYELCIAHGVTPGHGSFPSGHATQVYAVAHVLRVLLGLDEATATSRPMNLAASQAVQAQLARQAARIATNRVVAGLHFPADSMAGRMLGTALGEFFAWRCKASNGFCSRSFHSSYLDQHPSLEFNPFDAGEQNLDAAPPASTATAPPPPWPLYTLDAKPPQAALTPAPSAAASLPQYSPAPQSDLLARLWQEARDEWKGHFGVPA